MAGLSSPATTSRPESVTALRTFFAMASGGSRTAIVPCGESADFDIFASGNCRSMILAPTGGMVAWGITNVSPYRELNRCAMSRVSSRCCRWSSPTGT